MNNITKGFPASKRRVGALLYCARVVGGFRQFENVPHPSNAFASYDLD